MSTPTHFSVGEGLVKEGIEFANSQQDLIKASTTTFSTNIIRSKASIKHEQHVQKLNVQLNSSRKHVLKYLLKSRALEQSISQASIIEHAVQKKFADPLHGRSRKLNLGGRVLWPDEISYAALEHACGMSAGFASILQNAYNSYHDHKLCGELEMLPDKARCSEDFHIFCLIVRASTHNQLSAADAKQIFDLGDSIFYCVDDSTDPFVKWNIMVHLLRKRMLLLHMANSIVKSIRVATTGGSLHVHSTKHHSIFSKSISAKSTASKSLMKINLSSSLTRLGTV